MAPRKDPPSRQPIKPAPTRRWKTPKHPKKPRDTQEGLRRQTYERLDKVVREQNLRRRRFLTKKLIADIEYQFGGTQLKSAKEFSKLVRAILATLQIRLRDETARSLKRKETKDLLFMQRRTAWLEKLQETIAVFEALLAEVQDIRPEE